MEICDEFEEKKEIMQILSLISKNQKTSLHSSLSFYTPYKNLYSKGFPFCALCPNDKQCIAMI